jgi:tetraacyldisaccharide 4'-kinase
VRDGLLSRWFRPGASLITVLLAPLAGLYGHLQRRDRVRQEQAAARIRQPGCPVVVVGNLIVGGAGKTPTTLAVVQALRGAGLRPGVVSRGHGRQHDAVSEVSVDADPQAVGDEPLLIRRRSGVPVFVGRDRVAAANQLLLAHPRIDVIVSDDGLQHRRLRRDVEVMVFDERGIGNGRLLPAGPLREPMPLSPPVTGLVLYNHTSPSTRWPGACTERRLTGAWPLAQWLHGGCSPTPLSQLRGRPLLAVAGIGVPERFFSALESEGLTVRRLPLTDHHDYLHPPWPPGTQEVITTEKDAVKIARLDTAGVAVWVVGLDLLLPAPFVAELLARVAAQAARRPAPPPPRDANEP